MFSGSLLLVFGVSFVFGLVLSLSTLLWNRERKKKRFRRGVCYGASKAIDERIEEEMKEGDKQKKQILDDDTMEYHASKKFR